jgi:geranylgeranyl diphosphate synthase, type II
MSNDVAEPDVRLDRWIDTRRTAIEDALERQLPTPPACPALIADAMRYSVRAGGKRLRPLLALAAAEAVGAMATPPLGAEQACAHAMPLACALELIHTYSLVHDDLPAMDNDVLRRGLPTLHVVHGEGMAILGGDALLTEAFAMLARGAAADDAGAAARTLRVITRIADAAGPLGMAGGQAIDLHLGGQGGPHAPPVAPPPDLAVLRDMHARKTGALIRAAATCGAIIVGGPEAVVQGLDEYGAELGLAFQIVDDILDVEGDAAALGKTAGKDAAAGKLTYPALLGLEPSKQMAREAITRAAEALARARVPSDYLLGIAQWVGRRTN